jgi:transposase-like protein
MRSAFAGFRFPPEVIVVAVRWYLRLGLSYRDGEELLAERGIESTMSPSTGGVQRLTPLLAEVAGPAGTLSEIAGSWMRPREGRRAVAGPVPSHRSVRPGH